MTSRKNKNNTNKFITFGTAARYSLSSNNWKDIANNFQKNIQPDDFKTILSDAKIIRSFKNKRFFLFQIGTKSIF